MKDEKRKPLRRLPAALTLFSAVFFASPVFAQGDLHAKAEGYQEWIETWHANDLGAITGAISFTDAARTEIACLHHQGDSMIWTGMYLGAEALRYKVTRDPDALAEVERVVTYMRDAMAMTETLGYLPRYAGEDVAPWNCGYEGENHDWKNAGEGEWAGYYWIDHTSRDQYSGWWWGMALAYEALAGVNEAMRQGIRDDVADVIEMLVTNDWNITDQNGEYTGNGAAWIGPMKRIAWLVSAAAVMDEPYYWELLDSQYELWKPFLWVDVFSGYNRYTEFYGNNLRHLDFQAVFRLWPDRERLAELWDVWQTWNRPWVTNIHNPWFDSVHVTGCLRLGVCDEDEYADIVEDHLGTLGLYWDPPSYQRAVSCSTLPLDPLSVTLSNLIQQYPWLGDIISISPQTAEARILTDRHWTDMYWQSTSFEASCSGGENQTYVGPGMDYLVAYWMGVYYGILPGEGPYGDDDLTDDDDPEIDDDADDDADDDELGASDDDAGDEDRTEAGDDAAGASDGGDGGPEDDEDGCGC